MLSTIGDDVPAAPRPPVISAEHRQELIGELEHRLLVLADQLRTRIAVAAAESDLTAQQAIVIRYLAHPRTMSELASLLGCDRSNVTGLIGRLERRGLVQRVSDPADRRVKRLVLTEAGQASRAELQARLVSASPATAGLDVTERHALLTLVRKLTPDISEVTTACSRDLPD
ncbi:MAG: MarR family transcriptional regulator [Thermomicrobiales bacterium]|nr:MarR family transcriptional regulator [Thermomicrobiales bacterium]